jgi:hypothetical protein
MIRDPESFGPWIRDPGLKNSDPGQTSQVHNTVKHRTDTGTMPSKKRRGSDYGQVQLPAGECDEGEPGCGARILRIRHQPHRLLGHQARRSQRCSLCLLTFYDFLFTFWMAFLF